MIHTGDFTPGVLERMPLGETVDIQALIGPKDDPATFGEALWILVRDGFVERIDDGMYRRIK